MIQEFVNRYMANKDKLFSSFLLKHPENYEEIVKAVIEIIKDDNSKYDSPDPDRIHLIDDGSYQGTLLFIIGDGGYQPGNYWYVKVHYGSCSGCDTLEGIRCYDDNPPSEEQAKQYETLALHIVQGLKSMNE